MDNRGYDILSVEIEDLLKVRSSFQFPTLIHPNFFHYMSTGYHHQASGRFKANSQQKPISATPHRTSPG